MDELIRNSDACNSIYYQNSLAKYDGKKALSDKDIRRLQLEILRDPIELQKVQNKLFSKQREKDKKDIEFMEQQIKMKKSEFEDIDVADKYAKDIYEIFSDDNALPYKDFKDRLNSKFITFDKAKLDNLIELWITHKLIRYKEDKNEYSIGLTLFSNRVKIGDQYKTHSELSMERYIKKLEEQNQKNKSKN